MPNLISKALRYGTCVTRGSQFYLPTTHEPCLPLLPSRKASLPLGQLPTKYCLVTEAHRCEKLAQSFYAACPAETRTHDLLITSLSLHR